MRRISIAAVVLAVGVASGASASPALAWTDDGTVPFELFRGKVFHPSDPAVTAGHHRSVIRLALGGHVRRAFDTSADDVGTPSGEGLLPDDATGRMRTDLYIKPGSTCPDSGPLRLTLELAHTYDGTVEDDVGAVSIGSCTPGGWIKVNFTDSTARWSTSGSSPPYMTWDAMRHYLNRYRLVIARLTLVSLVDPVAFLDNVELGNRRFRDHL